jgi:hypothetical protein
LYKNTRRHFYEILSENKSNRKKMDGKTTHTTQKEELGPFYYLIGSLFNSKIFQATFFLERRPRRPDVTPKAQKSA